MALEYLVFLPENSSVSQLTCILSALMVLFIITVNDINVEQ